MEFSICYQPPSAFPKLSSSGSSSPSSSLILRKYETDDSTRHELRILQRLSRTPTADAFYFLPESILPHLSISSSSSSCSRSFDFQYPSLHRYQPFQSALLECRSLHQWIGMMVPALQHVLQGLHLMHQRKCAYTFWHPDAFIVLHTNTTLPLLTNLQFVSIAPFSPCFYDKVWPEEDDFCLPPEWLARRSLHRCHSSSSWTQGDSEQLHASGLCFLHFLPPISQQKHLAAWKQCFQQEQQQHADEEDWTASCWKTWDSYGLAMLFFWYLDQFLKQKQRSPPDVLHPWLKPLAKLFLQQLSVDPAKRLSCDDLLRSLDALCDSLDSCLPENCQSSPEED